MKRLFLLLILVSTFVAGAKAQQNLRDGYVITLKGDTLYGVIDFRTSAMNTKRCVFRENGATEDFVESMHLILNKYNIECLDLHDIDKQWGHPSQAGMKAFADQVVEYLSK